MASEMKPVFYNGILMRSDWAEAIEEAQLETHYLIEGESFPRIPYGLETFRHAATAAFRLCRHCHVTLGQLHEPLCDWEQCPNCGDGVMSCECSITGHGDSDGDVVH